MSESSTKAIGREIAEIAENQAKVYRQGFKCGTRADNKQVYDAGYEAGNTDGYDKGHSDGYYAGKSEGGGVVLLNRTSMAYWYQYLVEELGIVYNRGMSSAFDYEKKEPPEELEYPQETQNVTSFAHFTTLCMPDNEMYQYTEHGLPIKRFTGTLDMTSATEISYMFANCTALEDLGNITFPKGITNLVSLFYACTSLKSVPKIDTSETENFSFMFYRCNSLTSVPELDTSKGRLFTSMFQGCKLITTISKLDTSKATVLSSTFAGCTSLTTIPELDTRTVTIFQNTFSGCTSLTSLPELDCRSATNLSNIVSNNNLTSLRLKNIKANVQIGSGSTYGHQIVVEDLIFMIYHLQNTGSAKTFTIGSANLVKLANVYVKTIEITDEMRAEDDLIDKKLPFEVCESTAEGAMLITTYVSSKNWALK